MKINRLTPVYFDIETSGLSAWEDEFVSWAIDCKNHDSFVSTDLERLGTYLIGDRHLIITWNGENHRGGFDFPWLRSKCLQKGIDWQLGGVKHLDLLPLVRKYLNTTAYEPPSKSDLYADDMKKLAQANDIEYSNKSQCYEELEQVENVDWLDYEQVPNEDNSLQSVYQKLFDPEKEEEYIDGERMPELYEEMTEKEIYNGGHLQQIKEHNRRDVERLKKIAEAVIPVIPDWEIERNINKL